MLSPAEIAAKVNDLGKNKAKSSFSTLIILGFLAGAFIAFAAQASTVASNGAPWFGLGRLVSGTVFTVGLMFVVLAGGELFTGNSLMALGLFKGEVSPIGLLRNWVTVYFANFAGSLTVAYLMNCSGLWHLNGANVGASVVSIALGKVTLSFGEALARGILCNWIVCLAVWIAVGAADGAGKILGMFFPIALFVLSGFEHSIANMYFVPAGILAKVDPAVTVASAYPASDAALTWANFITKNLVPVTIGNVIGGVVFVALLYWGAYGRKAG